jgi:hypothetical protein
MSFSSEARKILVLLFGVANALAGGFFLWLEMQGKTPHSGHVYLFAGWIALGMAMVAPSQVLGTAKAILALLPSIKIGGNGASKP